MLPGFVYSEQGSMAGCCEHGNERRCSIKDEIYDCERLLASQEGVYTVILVNKAKIISDCAFWLGWQHLICKCRKRKRNQGSWYMQSARQLVWKRRVPVLYLHICCPVDSYMFLPFKSCRNLVRQLLHGFCTDFLVCVCRETETFTAGRQLTCLYTATLCQCDLLKHLMLQQ
jgi:hypothetical protein